jgi:hypothetical protein
MKKFFVMIAAAIVCMSASAQVEFGAKVGFDMTNYWGKDVEHGMKPGYQAGLMMEYKFTDRFAIAPEVVFAAQGGKSKAISLDFDGRQINVGTADIKFTANYINVPVMLKFYATPEFSIDFGPQVGFNVYNKFSAKGLDESFDIKEYTKPVDFGLGLGATYNLTDNAFIQARYTLGLTNAYKDNGLVEDYLEGLFGDNDAKNSNIQIAFGMKF